MVSNLTADQIIYFVNFKFRDQVSQMQQQQQQQQTTAPVQVQIGIGRNTVQKTVQAHSSLQPTQSNYSGQQFIVTSKLNCVTSLQY